MKADSSAVRPGGAVWRTRSAWTRAVCFFGFWVVLMPSPKPAAARISSSPVSPPVIANHLRGRTVAQPRPPRPVMDSTPGA